MDPSQDTTPKPSMSDDAATITSSSTPPRQPKSRAFWMSFIAIMVSTFLSAIDLTAVGTALPTIAEALNDTKGEYVWVGSAYTLSSTAVIPLSGSLADALGRRPVMLMSIVFFAVGSALAGAAQNMDMMIAARAIQGIGGGGILVLTEILVADLVPLAERGVYQGMIGFVWSLASSIGPAIGGALSNKGHKAWRALFYMNLPFTGLAFLLVWLYLSVRTPEGTVSSKLAKVDWIGNGLVIVGSTLSILGLSWGGIRYPWDSAQVLAPLIIGLALLVAFGVYEAKVPARPAILLDVFRNRTSLSGILTTAAHSVVSISLIYYLPVFFQACLGASPIRSAVDLLPAALLIAPMGLAAGVTVAVTKKYRPVNWVGWAITIIGFGLFSTVVEDSSKGKWVGYQLVVAVGVGMIFTGPVFPILAPLPNNHAASALALFSFIRTFFQTWGITISGTILQNMLKKNLPADFVAQFPPNFEIAYAAIPAIKLLEEPVRTAVRAAFARSMRAVWQTMIGISGLGLLLSLIMAEVPMDTSVDETYALEEREKRVEDV
ncbi:iron permease [Roridomyces roridus]|uniref:Iron permease n=1 Tax=Roridomyces roridus TaxID=1738132 RepID=A0AAD7FTI0_9AGAR|nr:iron permease [Roridomyces roridus]